MPDVLAMTLVDGNHGSSFGGLFLGRTLFLLISCPGGSCSKYSSVTAVMLTRYSIFSVKPSKMALVASGMTSIQACLTFPLGFMGGVVSKISAHENSRYIARLYGLDPDYVEAFCRWLCGLGEYFDQPLGTYSSGMRARFSFALMLALDFDIYLVDEGMPSSTDVDFNRKAGEVLKERLQTTTMIIVSHQAKTLEKFAKSAAVLRNGKLHMFDTLEEAKQLYDYQTQG